MSADSIRVPANRESTTGEGDFLDHAFILGAGLGTRLRPLTEYWPKPLVPVLHRPLITHGLDHLIGELGIRRVMINTHHCPEKYAEAFPGSAYRDVSLEFRYEPELLETGGGLDNIRDWAPADAPLMVYNGDNLTDLPLRAAFRQHLESGDVATLILRTSGKEKRVGYDPGSRKVIDMRGLLERQAPDLCQFTGVYLVSPGFFSYLRRGKAESVVFPLLDAIRDGEKVGGVVVDEGNWTDLGDRDAYLSVLKTARDSSGAPRIHPTAQVDPTARIDEWSCVGPGAKVGRGAVLEECVLWEGAVVEDQATLRRCVVRDGQTARGNHTDRDW